MKHTIVQDLGSNSTPILRERCPVDNLFEEIAVHFPKVDPIQATIDGYLEDEHLNRLIKGDLSQRQPKSLETGRKTLFFNSFQPMAFVFCAKN